MASKKFAMAMAAMLVLSGAARAEVDEPDAQLLKQAQALFKPLPKDFAPADAPLNPLWAELGRKLFFDRRVSVDGTTSCMRCHEPGLYATDGMDLSHGNHDKTNARNAPTILNVAGHSVWHWLGDRKSVEDQAMKALTGSASLGNPDAGAATSRLKAIAGYAALFARAYPGEQDPVTPENFGKAVGAYERTLATPSRFDDYLQGKTAALSTQEKSGMRTFIDIGCSGCHAGVGVGGEMMMKFGVTADYWTLTGVKEPDKGRYAVTHDDADLYVFKVPGLRNVAMTPPYFHDGSVRSLPDAVRIMAKAQLGQDLNDGDLANIVAFLGALTGDLPRNFVESPILPPSAFAK